MFVIMVHRTGDSSGLENIAWLTAYILKDTLLGVHRI